MKKFILTFFPLLIVTQICFAQWYEQNSGVTVDLNAVRSLDVNNGFAVGDSGTILKTSNGGNNWTIQSSGTMNDLYSSIIVATFLPNISNTFNVTLLPSANW